MDKNRIKGLLRRAGAAAPAVAAVLGVAMSAGSGPRPDVDRTSEAVSRITGGDLGEGGLNAIKGRLTPSQLEGKTRFVGLSSRPKTRRGILLRNHSKRF